MHITTIFQLIEAQLEQMSNDQRHELLALDKNREKHFTSSLQDLAEVQVLQSRVCKALDYSGNLGIIEQLNFGLYFYVWVNVFPTFSFLCLINMMTHAFSQREKILYCGQLAKIKNCDQKFMNKRKRLN